MPAIVAILVTFQVNPGHKEEFVRRLGDLVDIMSKEDTFLNSFVTESAEDPNVLYNYETWAETQESFMATQFTKAYREPYEAEVPRLLANREITWLSAPIIRRETDDERRWGRRCVTP